MSGLDDRLNEEVSRLAGRVEPAGVFERVERKAGRRRIVRRIETALLATAIIGGTVVGAFVLARVFDAGEPGPIRRPVTEPGVSTSPGSEAAERCPDVGGSGDPPAGYEREAPPRVADIVGDGDRSRVGIFGDEDRPFRCRYLLVLEHTGGSFLAPITTFDWVPQAPTILLITEVDGDPGLEVIVEFGGPGHPHRTGEVFTFEGDLGAGELVQMTLEPSEGIPPMIFPLYGEFVGAVDCTGDPGAIVVTTGDLAPGVDTHYAVTRAFYEADGSAFVLVGEERFRVPVGSQGQRWPEVMDRSFRSCPSG